MRYLVLVGLIVLLAAPSARAADCIVLEDFSRSKVGEFPVEAGGAEVGPGQFASLVDASRRARRRTR